MSFCNAACISEHVRNLTILKNERYKHDNYVVTKRADVISKRVQAVAMSAAIAFARGRQKLQFANL